MSLRDVIADNLAWAAQFLDDEQLLVTVTHKAWTGQAAEGGTPTYATISRKAVVTKKQTLVRSGGREILSQHQLFFPEPLTDTTPIDPVRYPRTNPVDPNDVFILPDGTKGVVIPVDGFYDSQTSRSFYQSVYLG